MFIENTGNMSAFSSVFPINYANMSVFQGKMYEYISEF